MDIGFPMTPLRITRLARPEKRRQDLCHGDVMVLFDPDLMRCTVSVIPEIEASIMTYNIPRVTSKCMWNVCNCVRH